MSTTEQTSGQAQRITCVVCDRPLPPQRYEGEEEPGYFPSSSTGYQAGDEGERACEDISQLLRYAQTVNDAIWDNFFHRALATQLNAKKLEGLELRGEEHYT